MVKSPIIFGIIGKKIYLTLLLALVLILHSNIKDLIPKGNDIPLINNLGGSVLEMISIFIPYIFKFKDKSKTTTIKCTKNIFIDYFIFLLIILLILGTSKLIEYFNIQADSLNSIDMGICIQMICYILLSLIILKSKYYIHHIISFILFCIFTVIIDLIFENFGIITFGSFLLILPNLLDDLFCCYQKYLIDKKYHSYWNILFFYGLYSFISDLIQMIIILIKDPNDNPIALTIRIGETKYIILNFFLDTIFNFLKTLLTMLILQYFSLNHVGVSHVLNQTVSFTITISSNYDTYKNYLFFLIPAVFQIISLLFFLEILEFNFCDLNKNTKRNIMLREESEMSSRNSVASDIEIDKDLIIKSQQDKDFVELCDMEGKDNDDNDNENNNENDNENDNEN